MVCQGFCNWVCRHVTKLSKQSLLSEMFCWKTILECCWCAAHLSPGCPRALVKGSTVLLPISVLCLASFVLVSFRKCPQGSSEDTGAFQMFGKASWPLTHTNRAFCISRAVRPGPLSTQHRVALGMHDVSVCSGRGSQLVLSPEPPKSLLTTGTVRGLLGFFIFLGTKSAKTGFTWGK